MLLTTAHFPPIQYLSKVFVSRQVIIEAHENYQRQSYRNRFRIMGANGPVNLSVPVVKGHSPGQQVKEVKVDYSESWQRVHYKTIKSAYAHSPFYEYYIDELKAFWERKWAFLYDLNLEILASVMEILGIETEIVESKEYSSAGEPGNDFRELIHPKRDWRGDTKFKPVAYTQNFGDRHGFIANLSIIDLLFQTGPESTIILGNSAMVE